MSNSNATHLEQLLLARDKITADIIAGKNVTLLTIAGKTAQYSASEQTLSLIERMISRYESKSATKAARNRARLRR